MAALISKGQQNRRGLDVPVVLGVELKDAQEEIFVILVCDGLPLGLAFKRAGFTSTHSSAPSNLFNLPRVQERARAILDARKTTSAVSLSEVTNMLQRVFAGANSESEYSAAHNAAFSLARLYGHVNDKSTLEIIRRPSRDPDAPSEQMLEDWAASLPVIGESAAETGQRGRVQGPPATLLGPGPSQLDLFDVLTPGLPANNEETQSSTISSTYEQASRDTLSRDVGVRGSSPEGPPPAADGPGETGNGAPGRPVTGTPDTRGGTAPLEKTGSPLTDEGTGIPSFEELFG